MKQNLNLNWLRTFEAAARLLSFTAASRELGLTQTAVSQHTNNGGKRWRSGTDVRSSVAGLQISEQAIVQEPAVSDWQGY